MPKVLIYRKTPVLTAITLQATYNIVRSTTV